MKSYNSKIATNDRVELIHVSLDREEADALKWAKSARLPWPHVLPKNYRKSGLKRYNRDEFANLCVLVNKDGKKLAEGDKATCLDKLAELTK